MVNGSSSPFKKMVVTKVTDTDDNQKEIVYYRTRWKIGLREITQTFSHKSELDLYLNGAEDAIRMARAAIEEIPE
jgi:methanogenic corrinoid protein MtbC1